MRLLLTAVLTAIALTGCASKPTPISQATAVPTQRLLAFQQRTEKATSTLVVIRDQGFYGSGCYFGFFIDDTPAGRFGPTELARFYVEPGEHIIHSGRDPLPDNPLCAMNATTGTSHWIVTSENEVQYFRLMQLDEEAVDARPTKL